MPTGLWLRRTTTSSRVTSKIASFMKLTTLTSASCVAWFYLVNVRTPGTTARCTILGVSPQIWSDTNSRKTQDVLTTSCAIGTSRFLISCFCYFPYNACPHNCPELDNEDGRILWRFWTDAQVFVNPAYGTEDYHRTYFIPLYRTDAQVFVNPAYGTEDKHLKHFISHFIPLWDLMSFKYGY